MRYRQTDGRLVVWGRDGQELEGPVAESDRWYRVRAGIAYRQDNPALPPVIGTGRFAIDEVDLGTMTVENPENLVSVRPQLTLGNRTDAGTYTAEYDDLVVLVGEPEFGRDFGIVASLLSGLDVSTASGAFVTSTGAPPTSTDQGLLSDPLDFGTSTWIAQDITDQGALIGTQYANPVVPPGKEIHAVTYWVVHNGSGTGSWEWRIEHQQGAYRTLVQNTKDGQAKSSGGTGRIAHANVVHPQAYPWTPAQLGDVRTEWFLSTDASPNPRMQQIRLEVMFVDLPGG